MDDILLTLGQALPRSPGCDPTRSQSSDALTVPSAAECT